MEEMKEETKEETKASDEASNEKPLKPFYGGAALSANVLINLLISIVGAVIILLFSLGDSPVASYISIAVSPIAIAVMSLIFFRVTRMPVKELIPIKTKPKYFIIGLLLIFGLLFSLNSLNDLLVKLFELMGYKRKLGLPDFSGWNVVPALIVIALLPAVAEEVLFRGIILNCSENHTGSVAAIFLSGFCFSLYHASVEQTVYQFICGCMFAFLAIRSRSVVPSMIIHFLNNAVIIILSACGCTDPVTGELILPFAVDIVLTVLSALSLIGAVVWLILDKTELKKRTKGGVAKFFLGASVGIVAMVILWVVNLFV